MQTKSILVSALIVFMAFCLNAQSVVVQDSMVLGLRRHQPKVACAHGSTLLELDDQKGVRIIPGEGGKEERVLPIARNLVLNCGGPFCYVNPLKNAATWKTVHRLTCVSHPIGYLGIHTQLTDIAFYDKTLNLLSSHPIEFPIFVDRTCLYHNYWSSSPAAFLGDTMALALIPTEVLFDSTRTLEGPLPSAALYDLSNLPVRLSDTLGKDTLRPFRTSGSFPSHYQSAFHTIGFSQYGGVRADTIGRKFLLYEGSSPSWEEMDAGGQIIRVVGVSLTKSNRHRYTGPSLRHWKIRYPDLVRFWESPVYSDVIPDALHQRIYRICLSPIDKSVQLGKRVDFMDREKQYMIDLKRKSYLQIYDYSSGMLLTEIAMPFTGARLLGVDSSGKLLATGLQGEQVILYTLSVN
jgi:hypothetical protein